MIKSYLIEKIYYKQWKCLHGCLYFVWYWEKNMQFGIMVFLEVQDINLQSNMQGNKCDEYCIFL